MLDQTAECLSGQPAGALIGRVVKVKVTETQKWHITGHITDASPDVPHVKADEYFAQCEAQRRDKEAKEAREERKDAKIERVIVEEKIKVKVTTQQALLHLAGMAALTVGVFATLKGIFGGAGVERASQIANVV